MKSARTTGRPTPAGREAPPQPSLDGLIRRLVTATPEELATVEQMLDGGENVRLLSVIEAAKRLRVSTWYVYELMRKGALEYVKPQNGFCKIPERVLEAYVMNLTKGGNIGKSGKGKNWRAGLNNQSEGGKSEGTAVFTNPKTTRKTSWN